VDHVRWDISPSALAVLPYLKILAEPFLVVAVHVHRATIPLERAASRISLFQQFK
jgi:hypothetical protein